MASSRLEMLQARFQQRQLAEKEQKLLQIYDQQQLRAHQVAQRGSAGSNGSNSPGHGNVSHHSTVTRTTTHSTSNSQGGGKVRQMFDERRQTNVKGIDKSYPLEPLDNRSRKHQTTTTTTTNVVVASSPLKNGNPSNNRRNVVTRKTVRTEANINDEKPTVSYREEVTREIDDSNDRDNVEVEFGDENYQDSRYENGNRRIDRSSDCDIEDVTNENITQRHKTTAKIHLSVFDPTISNREIIDPDNDDSTENPTIDTPLKSSTIGGKKSSQIGMKVERPKNPITKKIGQTVKQTGNTTSFTKKRNESVVHSGTSSRASTTRTLEEDISRGSSISPDNKMAAERPRNKSPEVLDKMGKCAGTIERGLAIAKNTGITKVSQLCHQKNSTDYYPRRKSEFEKSKTFRKLQLELGESSPEPIEPDEDSSIIYGKQCRKRSTIHDENIYERRSSSPRSNIDPHYPKEVPASPMIDRDYSKVRKTSHEISHASPGSRERSASPSYRRDSIKKSEERKTSEGLRTSHFESSTYSSRQHSAYASPIGDRDYSQERETSHEISHTSPGSREGSPSPSYRRDSMRNSEERKTSEGLRTSHVESSTFSSRQHTASASPIIDRDYSQERKTSHKILHASPGSRERSASPRYRRDSIIKSEEEKISGGLRPSHVEFSTFSSRQHSAYASPIVDRDYSQERETSHEISHTSPGSREGSPSPSYRRDSTRKSEERKTSEGLRTSHVESSTFSSRQHTASASPIVDRDYSQERQTSHKISHASPGSRERSASPRYRRDSIIKSEEEKISEGLRPSHVESSTFSSRQHSAYASPIVDRDYSQERETSHEISHTSPGSREGSPSPSYRRDSMRNSVERKTSEGLRTSHVESSTFSSRQHTASASPIIDRDYSQERQTSHEISHASPGSRERSASPRYRRDSIIKSEDEKISGGLTPSHVESSTFSSRQHSAYASPIVDRDYSQERETSHEISHTSPRSREGSPSPSYRRDLIRKSEERKTSEGLRTSHAESSTFSSRQHTASASPIIDRDYSQERKTSHEILRASPGSRQRSASPSYRRDLIIKSEEEKISEGLRPSHVESSTYSSRQHSAYASPIVDRDYSQERETSHEISHTSPRSREGSPSPSYRRDSIRKSEERKTSEGLRTLHAKSSTFSSRQHVSTASPIVDRDYSQERKTSHEILRASPGSRQRSASPSYRRDSIIKHDEEKTSEGLRTSHFDSSTYSSRQHSASASPLVDRDYSQERQTSHEISHASPGSRERSASPNYRRDSIIKHDEEKTSEGLRTSHFDSSTYSSRQHTASASPIVDRDYSKEPKTSHEMSHASPKSREGSPSPSHRRGSSINSEEGKTSEGLRTTHFESSTFSSRQHSDYASPIIDRHCSQETKTSHELSHASPGSRERSPSPSYRKDSIRKSEERKTCEGLETSHFETSTFSSRQHTASPRLIIDRDYSEEAKASHELSRRPESRERSASPTYRRDSILKSEERKTSEKIMKNKETKSKSGGTKSSHLESSIYSSKNHSSSASPKIGRNYAKERKTSLEKSRERPGSQERSPSPTYPRKSSAKSSKTKTSPSPIIDRSKQGKTNPDKSSKRPKSRGGSQSPIHQKEEFTKIEERKTTTGGTKTSNFDSRTYSSRRRSSSASPVEDYPKQRKSSHEKSPKSPSSRVTSPSPRRRSSSTSPDLVKGLRSRDDREDSVNLNRRKSGGTLSSVELVKKLIRPASPDKKTCTSTARTYQSKITLEDIENSAKSSDLGESSRRSKSPEHNIVKKDKAPVEVIDKEKRRDSRDARIEKNRKDSLDIKGKNSKNRQEIVPENIKGKNSKNRQEIVPENSDSRRSSSVKRHDTLRVSRPVEKIVRIVKPKNLDRKIVNETKDKIHLLERIEKIKNTLSRSGKSEQNLQSKEYERTDSVESALKRFDSIGVETEHRVTIGRDEIDDLSKKPSPEPFLTRPDVEVPKSSEIVTKKSTDTRGKSGGKTIAIVKAQPRKIDAKSRLTSKEKVSRGNVREKNREITKIGKTREEKSILTSETSRQCDNKMAAKSRDSQKRATSMVKKSKLRSAESSGRGEAKAIDSSPLCKRRLFEDSESEIENERSSIVLTTIMKEKPEIGKFEGLNNRDNVAIVTEVVSFHEESKIDNEPAKLLRSIEDIRKSIKRESQDFKRELKKFNTVMREEAENTTAMMSRVEITKTLKIGDKEPAIEIERSSVKLPIDHRVAKSPSPDIGVKRTIEGRARRITTTTPIRRSVPSSPAKSPDSIKRYGSSELRIPVTKSVTRTSSRPGSSEEKNQIEITTSTEYTDSVDGPENESQVTVTEIVSSVTKNNAESFVVDLDDDVSNRGKPSFRKKSSERSLTSKKQEASPTSTPISRPTSGISTTSGGSNSRGQASPLNSKTKMSTKTKTSISGASKGPPPSARATPTSTVNDGLAACKICGRRFNSDRVTLHEQICSKTSTKKRKTFDATIHRVKGTELEPFVKKNGPRKSQADRKNQKPEVKSNWRRKHEDFINAIRSAKQVQAHLAAGGKLSDLPPPPPSDTSDYVQCPHCGRKFNQSAAERHIPKCQTMLHNKPNSRAPPKPKR